MAAVPSSGAGDKHDAAASELAVRQLLDRAWNKIGRPNANLQETQAALADVLAAVTLTRGAAGVTQVLDQTKSQFAERQRQAAAEAAEEDRLRAQFAQRKQELRTAVESLAEDTCEQLAEASSLLRDHGKSNLLLEAFTNGSSVVCTRCEMLVKRERWEMHNTRWCSRLADGGSGHREEA